jgi:hypothetical protein
VPKLDPLESYVVSRSWRRRAQQEKTSRVVWTIDEDTNQLEQLRGSLNFVDDDKTRKSLERRHRSGQSLAIHWALQIEKLAWIAVRNDPGERRLPALAWPEQGGDGIEL